MQSWVQPVPGTEVASFPRGVCSSGGFCPDLWDGARRLAGLPFGVGSGAEGCGDPKGLSEAKDFPAHVSASSFFFQQRSPCQAFDQVEEVGGVWGHWNHGSQRSGTGCVLGTPCKLHFLQGTRSLCWEVPEALRPHRQAPERGGARLADKWRRPRTPMLLLTAVCC